jgi:hypothetical protein
MDLGFVKGRKWLGIYMNYTDEGDSPAWLSSRQTELTRY